MRALREQIEKRPKISEDNGYWMPTGSRLELKICPQDSAVPTDHRHRWSRKWTWSLWPVGNVPGTWVWMADEEGVAPSDMHVWPSTARPILTAVYICPTETYKDAQHASTDHVQLGRQHSSEPMSTCQTCTQGVPPREKNKREQTEKKCLAHCIQPPPRELTGSMQLFSCPTRLMIEQQSSKNVSWCPGTSVAPSHRPSTPLPASQLNKLPHSLTAWDKRQRVGEASNPGPEPPREKSLKSFLFQVLLDGQTRAFSSIV